MRREGVAILALLMLPGLVLPYARRTKTTIGPPSAISLIEAKRGRSLGASRVIVIVPAVARPFYPVVVERPYVIQTPLPMMGYPAIYPVPVYAPSQSSSASVADLLFLQALNKMDRELEDLRDEVRTLREQIEAPRCPTCGRPMKPGWNLCPYDGTRLIKGPEPAPGAAGRRPPSAEPEERPAPAEPPKAVERKPKPSAAPAVPKPEEIAPKPVPKRAAEAAEGWVVDWDRNLMRAVGRASLDEARGDPDRARRLALERAYDSLREGLLDLWGRRPKEDVDPYQWAAELIQHAKVAKEKQLPDGTWEVEVELRFGEPEKETAPEGKPYVGREKAEERPSAAPALKEAPQKAEIEREAEEKVSKPAPRSKGPYTGLIVDARGLGLKPAMSPKIWDENGRLVWQKVKVSPEFVIKKGIVAYARSLDEAKKNPRAGKNPLVVKSKGVRGPFKADPVISAEDANLVLDENKRTKFLDKCNVVFVID